MRQTTFCTFERPDGYSVGRARARWRTTYTHSIDHAMKLCNAVATRVPCALAYVFEKFRGIAAIAGSRRRRSLRRNVKRNEMRTASCVHIASDRIARRSHTITRSMSMHGAHINVQLCTAGCSDARTRRRGVQHRHLARICWARQYPHRPPYPVGRGVPRMRLGAVASLTQQGTASLCCDRTQP